MPTEKSCGAVIFKRDGDVRYLLLHYKGGHWDFVKGHVEKGENEEETVRRETEEEAGIKDLTFIPGYRVPISYFYRREGKTYRKEVVFFLVQAESYDVKLSWEHVAFAWLPFKEAYDRLTYRNAKEILGKAHELLLKQQTSKG